MLAVTSPGHHMSAPPTLDWVLSFHLVTTARSPPPKYGHHLKNDLMKEHDNYLI